MTPGHLPRLALLHRALDDLRATLPEQVWQQDWEAHFGRLEQLRTGYFTSAEWAAAHEGTGPDDHAAVTSLLGAGAR